MFGLSKKGFKRKRYDDIIESMNQRAQNLFGENINLSERSPLGLFFRVIAWFIAQLWSLAEKVYNSAYIDTAEGIQMDHVAKYIGISRRPAQRAVGSVVITGDEGTRIPSSLLIATKDDVAFRTIENTSIGEDGIAIVQIQAIDAGKGGNVPAETITELVTPIPGIQSVINLEPTIEGRDEETDEEFRARYYISTAAGGASTVDSIRASLLEVPGVRAANVIENVKRVTDSEDRPPKSLHCYTLGGSSKDIAQTILETKAGGIETYGDQMEIVKDLSGQEHEIRFSYAEVVNIHIRIAVTRNVKYPLDGDNRLKNALIRYIGGQDTDNALHTGLGMNQKVTYTRLIDIAYNVEGIEDLDLEVSTDGINWIRSNIAIGANQVAETSHDKVVIFYA